MSTKIDIRNPKKYFGKEIGDNQFARVAHVNHAIKIAEQAKDNEQYQLDMPYMWYPEASQLELSGTKITYDGGPSWNGYKFAGSVVPSYGNLNGNLYWYLCTIRIKEEQGGFGGPLGIIPHALTGMISTHQTTVVPNEIQVVNARISPIAPGAQIWDFDANQAVSAGNVYIQTSAWNNGQVNQNGELFQDLFLVIETPLENWYATCFYQFEFLLPDGYTATRFFD